MIEKLERLRLIYIGGMIQRDMLLDAYNATTDVFRRVHLRVTIKSVNKGLKRPSGKWSTRFAYFLRQVSR